MKLKNPLLTELNRWAYADNILDVFVQSKTIKSASPAAPISGPLKGDGIVMGSEGINAKVTSLKEEYVEEYGQITTEEAKLIIKAIFPKNLSALMLEPESYTNGQLAFALDVGAYALVMDYDSAAIQITKFNLFKAIKAAADLWDTPDADDLKDELDDGFDDLSWASRGVVQRYDTVSMGSGGIFNYFMKLK